jgi:hypothetical protein
MRTIALLTALVMSAATAAYADPPRTYDRDRDRDRDREAGVSVTVSRDHYDHYGQSRWSREYHGRWTPLSPYATLPNTRQFVPAGNQHFRKLRIEGLRGEPMIAKVAIQFDNGATQIIDVNTSFPAGAGEVLDLAGGVRSVHRVIVYSEPHSRGSYTVYGG